MYYIYISIPFSIQSPEIGTKPSIPTDHSNYTSSSSSKLNALPFRVPKSPLNISIPKIPTIPSIPFKPELSSKVKI